MLFVSNLLFSYLPFYPLEAVSSNWASRNMYPNEIQFILNFHVLFRFLSDIKHACDFAAQEE